MTSEIDMKDVKDGNRVRPLRVVARLKNNRLIRAREALGYATTTAAANAMGLPVGVLCYFENLNPKFSPVVRGTGYGRVEGNWTKTAMRIAIFYKLPPEYLWPEALQTVQRTVSTAVECLESPTTPEEDLASSEMLALAVRSLDLLTPVETRIIKMRFGLGGDDEHTLEETGIACHGISRERTRQLQERALTTLRKTLDKAEK